MSNAANLSDASINLSLIREYGRRELINILSFTKGKKGLVLDPKVSGPLNLVVEVALLKENGVEKIYHLTPEKLNTECRSLIYIVRSKISNMKAIANHILSYDGVQNKEYFIYFVPRKTKLCMKVLEDEGVLSKVTKIGEYALDLIPYDDDVVSLEIEGAYREAYLDGDYTSLYYAAKAIMKLQNTFGIIRHLKGKGNGAKIVIDQLENMRKEGPDPDCKPEIDTLIVIDRHVDLVTPMCTQLTYEGLIDEIFSINNGFVELDQELVNDPNEKKPVKQGKVKFPLNSNDKLYSEVRDLNFSILGPELNKKAKDIDEYYKTRHEAQTVHALRDFVKRLAPIQQKHQSLRIHTNVAEKILAETKKRYFHKRLEAEQSFLVGADVELSNEYIEECINRQEPLTQVLRLLVLQSQTNNGFKPKVLEFFKREIIQTYGYEYMFTLNNFEKLGLLKKQEGRATFPIIRDKLKLIVEDNPNDIASVYSIYAPLSIRLVQLASGWKQIDDVLKLLPGPTVEISDRDSKLESPLSLPTSGSNPRTPLTIVFFLGGCTFTEISALRLLKEKSEGRQDYLIMTTKIIKGDTFLNSLMSYAFASPK